MSQKIAQREYLNQLVSGFWQYAYLIGANEVQWLEEARPRGNRPPVFAKESADRNIAVHPNLSDSQRAAVIAAIPRHKRHRWFASMKSSQALAQSVFGNLEALRRFDLLESVRTDAGDSLLHLSGGGESVALEHSVDGLGEHPGRSTEIDAFFEHGGRRLAIECKLTEDGIGTCSRTRLAPRDGSYCDGSYSTQVNRKTRCALSEEGVRYWDLIPLSFNWDADKDHEQCPLNKTYQLVRNVLAVRGEREDEAGSGSVVLMVDERNPEFRKDGDGRKAFEAAKASLADPRGLQWCTWQRLVASLRADAQMAALADILHQKYGL